MSPLNVYIAGRVSADSSFSRYDWRDDFCKELEQKSGMSLINLDPTKGALDENNARLVFGFDCFLIRQSDLVIVYLSDDISVGGSQEILIAKYYNKPVLGIARKGGIFCRDTTIYGREYKNWTHPFVAMTCDAIVHDHDAAAHYIQTCTNQMRRTDIHVIDDAVRYYESGHSAQYPVYSDAALPDEAYVAQKGIIINAKTKQLLVNVYRNDSDVSPKVRGRFGLPGGKIHAGNDTGNDFASRVKEETGVTVRPRLPFSSWAWSYDRGGRTRHISAFAWFAEYEGGDIARPQVRKDETDLDHAEWIEFDAGVLERFIDDERVIVQQFLAYSRENPFAAWCVQF
jgi:ADP-ribose pyrophosphatase YjhB (NUDIX family)